MNSVIATTRSSIYLAVKHIWPEVPINAGLFEPIRIIEPKGTFRYAEYPRPSPAAPPRSRSASPKRSSRHWSRPHPSA
jgi:N-methylhydantoinase B/oxoprolinase/acetone carboxylase alpha subunit